MHAARYLILKRLLRPHQVGLRQKTPFFRPFPRIFLLFLGAGGERMAASQAKHLKAIEDRVRVLQAEFSADLSLEAVRTLLIKVDTLASSLKAINRQVDVLQLGKNALLSDLDRLKTQLEVRRSTFRDDTQPVQYNTGKPT